MKICLCTYVVRPISSHLLFSLTVSLLVLYCKCYWHTGVTISAISLVIPVSTLQMYCRAIVSYSIVC